VINPRLDAAVEQAASCQRLRAIQTPGRQQAHVVAGGQPLDVWAPVGYGNAGNLLFVTCGIGFSIVPTPVAAPAQVVFFDLCPEQGGLR
jgi:hypothetical protein